MIRNCVTTFLKTPVYTFHRFSYCLYCDQPFQDTQFFFFFFLPGMCYVMMQICVTANHTNLQLGKQPHWRSVDAAFAEIKVKREITYAKNIRKH